MVIESAQLAITRGREVEFERAMVRGRQILEDAPGSGAVTVARGVEDPSTFVLLVEWESVEVHQAAMEDPAFLEFRDLVRSFYAGPAKVQHFAPVAQ